MMEMARAAVRASLEAHTRLLESDTLLDGVTRAAEVGAAALRSGGKILLFGNGGSAADAQHIAAEFVGRFRSERPPLSAAALTVDASVLTGLANDYGYHEVFARQIEATGRPGDVAFGISTSGSSDNVVAGLAAAARLGLRTVALTGSSGGPVAAAAEQAIEVPATDTARVQECHILVGHILCELIEALLADGDGVSV
jgi:D-sedoheptulose 7-phosphate isomerase